MSDVIYRLKEEHRRLAVEFQKASVIENPSKEYRAAVRILHERLFAHLRHEEERLYSVVEELAKADESVRGVVMEFRALDAIMPGIKALFYDYVNGNERPGANVSAAHNQILRLFMKRFKNEEAVLYRLIEPVDGSTMG